MVSSLYIHIPFCVKRCVYCDFVSGVYDPGKSGVYVDALKKEISGIPAGAPLDTIYIGGGTPTALSSDELSDLVNHVFNHFQCADRYEATIEANPGTVDREKLTALRAAGINRISIGVQSFHNKELALLGRTHSSEEAEQAVLLARDSGFENTGIDLIYGIPGQSLDRWKATLEKAVHLSPQHISTYELTVEEGTVLYAMMKSNTVPEKKDNSKIPRYPPFSEGDFPDSPLWERGVREDVLHNNLRVVPRNEESIIEMYTYAVDYLTSSGYVHYEISNFARPGFLCRHNLNYWDRGEYYGAGLGAHSFTANRRFHNTTDLDEYVKAIYGNRGAVPESEPITGEKALSEAIFLGLRKTGGINLNAVSATLGTDIASTHLDLIHELQKEGLVDYDNKTSHLCLTLKGILLSNEIFARFL
jgi:oxygen-independent coproporphyrinogen-3 oxidase